MVRVNLGGKPGNAFNAGVAPAVTVDEQGSIGVAISIIGVEPRFIKIAAAKVVE